MVAIHKMAWPVKKIYFHFVKRANKILKTKMAKNVSAMSRPKPNSFIACPLMADGRNDALHVESFCENLAEMGQTTDDARTSA